MKSITLQISDEELLEVAEAYKTLQNFLEKIISPNEFYTDEFLKGLQESRTEMESRELIEVKNFADFIQ